MHASIRRLIAPIATISLIACGLAAAPFTASADPLPGRGSVVDSRQLTNREVFPGGLYVEQATDAAKAAARLQAEGRGTSAALMRQISSQPTAVWLGDWFTPTQISTYVARHLAAAKTQGTTPVFVTYAVPNRDCGGYSAGGLSPDAYLTWNRALGQALMGSKSVVIVEPDGLAMLTRAKCGNERDRRLPLISSAVDILADAGVAVYLDAGNSKWVKPDVMAGLLKSANIQRARGFATNVANYNRVDEERAFADALSPLVGGKYYVIDVSRNGRGWLGDWCNPPGAGLGQNPRVTYGTTKLDALLWVKHPGASDGTCNGGPAAGKWWDSYALALVRNR